MKVSADLMGKLSAEELVEVREILSLAGDMAKMYAKGRANYISGERYPRLFQAEDESDADFKVRLTAYKKERANGFHRYYPDLKRLYEGRINRLKELLAKIIEI